MNICKLEYIVVCVTEDDIRNMRIYLYFMPFRIINIGQSHLLVFLDIAVYSNQYMKLS